MKLKHLALALLFSLASAISATADPVTIHCPADPPRVTRFQLQETWRIDTEDPESPLISYFSPNQVFLHEDRVYLLDPQLCHILIYSDQGNTCRRSCARGRARRGAQPVRRIYVRGRPHRRSARLPHEAGVRGS